MQMFEYVGIFLRLFEVPSTVILNFVQLMKNCWLSEEIWSNILCPDESSLETFFLYIKKLVEISPLVASARLFRWLRTCFCKMSLRKLMSFVVFYVKFSCVPLWLHLTTLCSSGHLVRVKCINFNNSSSPPNIKYFIQSFFPQAVSFSIDSAVNAWMWSLLSVAIRLNPAANPASTRSDFMVCIHIRIKCLFCHLQLSLLL